MKANTNWISHPTELTGKRTKLVPLSEAYFDALCALGKEKSIWTFSPIGADGSDSAVMLRFLNRCLEKRDGGEFYPFVVLEKETGSVLGFTLFHSIKPENKSMEIGCTWFPPAYWGKGFNTECKYLMLAFCFEAAGAIRVQIKASDTNIRSRKAIEKTGFTFEGILRFDKILEDGSYRNAAYYSIINEEWNTVKNKFKLLL